MAELKTVGIKELKNNLSGYLREVRRGTRILVADRNVVVAELREPGAGYGTSGAPAPLIEEWVRVGTARGPSREKGPLPESPVKLDEGSAGRLLDSDRGEER